MRYMKVPFTSALSELENKQKGQIDRQKRVHPKAGVIRLGSRLLRCHSHLGFHRGFKTGLATPLWIVVSSFGATVQPVRANCRQP